MHGTNRKEINKDLRYELKNKGGTRPNKETAPNKVENKRVRVAITHGDTNGVGYELIFKTFSETVEKYRFSS